MIGVSINVAGAKTKLRRFRNQFSARQILQSIGNAHLHWIGQNFKAEGSLGGSKWKPLSARTLAGRKKSGRGAKILRDTGRLSMSFVSGGSSNIFRIGPQSVTVGTEVDYAEQHEKGIDVPKRKMLPTKLKAKALAKAEVMAIYRKATR
tara:strand:+ start:8505 stop:8951 length:447 start_codon:yes stop_codon:yes gene_type:complete